MVVAQFEHAESEQKKRASKGDTGHILVTSDTQHDRLFFAIYVAICDKPPIIMCHSLFCKNIERDKAILATNR